jgi:hypothetical protein
MTQEHPITPPPELVREWQIKIEYCSKRADREAAVAKIFQFGADMELEACCQWQDTFNYQNAGNLLRNARRPKSPSLKEQALLQLDTLNADLAMHGMGCDLSQIRRAIESLPD